MSNVATIGLDLAKSVFQVRGVDAEGRVLVQRRLRRAELPRVFETSPPCLVRIEACATAHHRAREIPAFGREVKLMPPACVKRGKTECEEDRGPCGAAQADERCRGDLRRGVTVAPAGPRKRAERDETDHAPQRPRTTDRRAALMLHKPRDLLVRQRTMLTNALRGRLAEFGIVAPKGPDGKKAAIEALHADQGRLPEPAPAALHAVVDQLRRLDAEFEDLEARIVSWRQGERNQPATIPGIGPITARAVAAAVPDGAQFRSGRQFAAWLGLTPKATRERKRVANHGPPTCWKGSLRSRRPSRWRTRPHGSPGR